MNSYCFHRWLQMFIIFYAPLKYLPHPWLQIRNSSSDKTKIEELRTIKMLKSKTNAILCKKKKNKCACYIKISKININISTWKKISKIIIIGVYF